MEESGHNPHGEEGPNGMVEVFEGVRFAVEIGEGHEAGDGISQTLASGDYPPEYRRLIDLLRLLTPPGGRVLDLGAHVGSVSLAASALGFEVAAVEASPRNAALLESSVRRNGFSKTRIVRAAVSDRSGTLDFDAFGPYGHVAQNGAGSRTIKVPALTGEQLLESLGWDRVDFIKLDIEGSEVAAIRGLRRRLALDDAPPIYYESNGYTLGFFHLSPLDLKSALEALGYRNYLVEPGRLIPVTANELQPETVVDYLALKRAPTGLPGWEVTPPRTIPTLIEQVLATCDSRNAAERSYIARALADSPRSIRDNSAVREAIDRLRDDPDPNVRDAASRTRPALTRRLRPWWRPRWMSRSA